MCKVICRKAGIELAVEPLSSSELNRGIVGQTESLIMALFQRAEHMPHLLCCIVSNSNSFFYEVLESEVDIAKK